MAFLRFSSKLMPRILTIARALPINSVRQRIVWRYDMSIVRCSIQRGGGMRSQEFKAVAVMALGFGLVGIDRFLIATMYPVISRDLHLSYGDIGVITGALALAWGASALFTGNASDRIGRRTVLVGSLIVFALLI